MDKTSFSVSKNYGHMEVRLKEYLDRRNITRYALANAANVRFEVIDRWYKGKIDRIDRDILARICLVLHCEVGDILAYIPPETTEE